ncbi:hypothetical protein RVF83_16460 [Gordonia rubripertincta]|uniref:hypothetical protein n=1 Tax=Gordonia rubripertincta TaxID=36822 RepID=UPI0030FEA686
MEQRHRRGQVDRGEGLHGSDVDRSRFDAGDGFHRQARSGDLTDDPPSVST